MEVNSVPGVAAAVEKGARVGLWLRLDETVAGRD